MRVIIAAAVAGVVALTTAGSPSAAGRYEASPEPAEGAQAPASLAKPWTMPRTPEGKPDLQGNWSNATLTPL